VQHLITADSYYGMLSTADAMLKTPHQFILSCKANYPFKPHTLARLGKRKGALSWTTTGGNLLVASWLDKKAINILTNAFERPETAGWRNGRPVPNFIKAYRDTLNFVDCANAYCLCYRFMHRVFKHTHAQFMTILYLAFVNSWLIYKHVIKLQQSKKGSYRGFFRLLMEWLAQAGGDHRLCIPQHQRRETAIRAVTIAAAAAEAARVASVMLALT